MLRSPVLPLCLGFAAVLPQPGVSQTRGDRTAFETAWDAWEAGAYPTALRGFEDILTAPGGDAWLRDIALVTGEWFHTSEVAADGTAPRWSPDGRLALFETPSASPERTHVVEITASGAHLMAELPGTRAVFSPSGDRVIYLEVETGPERDHALAEARSGPPPRNRAELRRRRAVLINIDARFTRVRWWERGSGRRGTIPTPELAVLSAAVGRDGTLLLIANDREGTTGAHLFAIRDDGRADRLTTETVGPLLTALPGGRHVTYARRDSVSVYSLDTGVERTIAGRAVSASADGSTLTYIRDGDGHASVMVMPVDGDAREVFRTEGRLDQPALSPTGDRVAFQVMERENWNLAIATLDGAWRPLTHDVQHDLFPRFLDDETILAVMGEGRHRRSYLYDVSTGQRTRFFHNNTVRTVAPEYEWAASPDGTRVLIVSERDGDTISPERGVYLVDRTTTVTHDEVLARVRSNLAVELDLRARGRDAFAPIAPAVREAVAEVSTARVYGYARDLFAFGTKYIGTPGNEHAIDYLVETLRGFGYEPELQWFEPRPGIRSANVIATLPGTVDPDVTYVVSSHFDSVNRGPGADDNSSGTTALLEAARVLADRPQARTIQFAFFTGEEAGLLGSREFVRRAVAGGVRIVGALNNDMVGYANDHRLDNTIRYSNAGIRDLQHAAAFLFTDLITYDAKYYKSTDAHAYYDAYGDIVGGIGSYPILANPHYHQSHDVLETINQQLVAEVSKTTVATLHLLTASPSRVKDLRVERRNGQLAVTWAASAESDVVEYVVTAGRPDDPEAHTVTVSTPTATLPDPGPDAVVTVTAVNTHGMRSWDRAVH